MAELLTMHIGTTTTQDVPLPTPAPPLKRCAIIGTAQSWSQCPWQDQTLEVWGLNDAYMIGVPKADRWYDLHPPSQMVFRPAEQRAVNQSEVPIGCYLRPHGHLQWLASRPMPVYVQQQRPEWPSSRTFPLAEILAFFQPFWPWRRTRRGVIAPGADWEVSTPAWMLMHAMLEGYHEIHVYGIHLASQWEFVQQSPNFSWLLGLAAGRGVKVVLPASTPICQANFRYAYELKGDIPLQTLEQEVGMVKTAGQHLKQALATVPWYAPRRRRELAEQLFHKEVELMDLRQAQQRVSVTVAR